MRFTLTIMSALLMLLPGVAYAANLSVFPASVSLKTGDSVNFTVRVQSKTEINTVGAAVILPKGLTFLSASDGPTLTEWIEHPAYHKEDATVSFAGIIPNGWSGDGVLMTVKVAALKPGVYSLAFDPTETEMYKNDGNATPEPIAFGTAKSVLFTTPFFLGVILMLIALLLIVRLLQRRYKIQFV